MELSATKRPVDKVDPALGGYDSGGYNGGYSGEAWAGPTGAGERRIIPAGQQWGHTPDRPWPWYTSARGNLYTRANGKIAIVFSVPVPGRLEANDDWAFIVKPETEPQSNPAMRVDQIRGEHIATQLEAQRLAMRALGIGERSMATPTPGPELPAQQPDNKLGRRIRL